MFRRQESHPEELRCAPNAPRHQVEVDIEPFKGLMLGLFFMSVGMGIDWRVLGDSPFWIAASSSVSDQITSPPVIFAIADLSTVKTHGYFRKFTRTSCFSCFDR